MSTPEIDGLLETSLYVSDLERSIIFYERIFCFDVLHSTERMCAMNAGGQQVLLLFQKGGSVDDMPTDGGVIPGHDGEGRLHLAFAIDPASFDTWTLWLGACDIPVESTVRWPRRGRSIYFRDPDGHLVELATPGVWENY